MAVRRTSNLAIIVAIAATLGSHAPGVLCAEERRLPAGITSGTSGLTPAGTGLGTPPPAVKPSSIMPVPWTPLLVRTALTPQPFQGIDGKTHLVYDLIFQNFSGASVLLESLELMGADGQAVADGTISGAIDRFPDQRIAVKPVGDHLTDYPEGNALVQDVGNDLYVVYAHLKPGSLKVKEGQRVKRGQVLARVGNSGLSGIAHLQMFVSDAPHPEASNGVPYVFDTFKVVGEIKDMNKDLEHGIEQTALCGDHKRELPGNGVVIVFPELQTH